jgi:hypothetical protein
LGASMADVSHAARSSRSTNGLAAREGERVSGQSDRRTFPWECGDERLKLAQLLGRLPGGEARPPWARARAARGPPRRACRRRRRRPVWARGGAHGHPALPLTSLPPDSSTSRGCSI